MHGAVLGQLEVGIAVGDLNRPPGVGHERHVGHGRADAAGQVRGHDRQPAALAHAGGDQRQAGHGRVAAGRVHGADRVGEQPGVVVRAGIGDAAGHEPAGARRAVVAGVRRVRAAPRAALAAGVHDHVDVAGAAPGQPVERVAAAAAVADVLQHHGAVRRRVVRYQQPPPDRVPAEPGERDVEHVGVPQRGAGRGELGFGCGGPGGGELPGPELVEVRGLGHVRGVAAKLGKRKVGEHGKERNGYGGPWPAVCLAASGPC